MIRRLSTRIVCLLTFAANSTMAADLYNSEGRVQRIERSLCALRSTPKDKLEDAYNYVSAMQGTRCRSSFARLRVQCLIEIAHDNCRDRRGNAKDDCLLYSDVIVVNHLSEDEFISPEQRYRIMRDHRDYRPRLRTALDREYAALTTRLILSIDDICKADDYPCLSKHIDTFCLDYADKHNISWQYCVAAMLWSVGTAETAPAPSMCSRENTGG